MKQLLAIGLALWLGGCAELTRLHQAYEVVTTTTVPASSIVIAANAFDALKATAVNYARYCIQGKFVDPICSAPNRRVVIKAVRVGTAARNQLEGALTTGTPAAATLYNLLIGVVNTLTNSPAINNFRKGTQ